jgi:LSD1 subclass zinc finger protein
VQTLQNLRPVSRPHWDGNRLTFDIYDGATRVRCAISQAALLDVAERRNLRPAELMDCFMDARPRIEAIASAKFRTRSAHATGLVNIWSDDIDPPPANPPLAACAGNARRSA